MIASRCDDPFSAPPNAGDRFPQRRTVARYPLTWQVEVFEPMSGTRFKTQTNSVNIRGCCVLATVSLDHNVIVRLEIQWRKETAEVWARVTGTADGTMGLAFLGTRQQAVLARWITFDTGSGRSLVNANTSVTESGTRNDGRAMSFTLEVREGVKWEPETSALSFATQEEAEAYMWRLNAQWTVAQRLRVVPSADPVNCEFTGGIGNKHLVRFEPKR